MVRGADIPSPRTTPCASKQGSVPAQEKNCKSGAKSRSSGKASPRVPRQHTLAASSACSLLLRLYAMFAVRSSCARCWRAGPQRTLATNAAAPRRRSPPSSEPTPEQLLQQHPAFRPPAAPAPSLPKRRGTPPTSARQPPPPPPVRPRAAVREPPLVERAREKTVGERSVWESYLGALQLGIPKKTHADSCARPQSCRGTSASRCGSASRRLRLWDSTPATTFTPSRRTSWNALWRLRRRRWRRRRRERVRS